MRGIAIGNQELNTETLLAVPIKDDEIFELLERLAATEEMFKASVSTIRDVAELTDASPNLIARLLAEMRGAGEFEKLAGRVDEHEALLMEVRQEVSKLGRQANDVEDNGQSFDENCSVGEQIVEAKIQTYAWIDSVETDRKSSQEKEINKARFARNRRIAYYCILIFAIWMVYATLTSSCSPPNGILVR